MAKYPIEAVLPHRSPMILIDELGEYDEENCCCIVTISTKSAFYQADKQGVPTYIGIEYMAQTIAAYAGAQALDAQKSVQIGFLLGSRKFKTARPYFALNEQLNINVKELYREESGLRVFDCSISDSKKQIIAQGNINVFQPKDAHAFIEQSHQ